MGHEVFTSMYSVPGLVYKRKVGTPVSGPTIDTGRIFSGQSSLPDVLVTCLEESPLASYFSVLGILSVNSQIWDTRQS